MEKNWFICISLWLVKKQFSACFFFLTNHKLQTVCDFRKYCTCSLTMKLLIVTWAVSVLSFVEYEWRVNGGQTNHQLISLHSACFFYQTLLINLSKSLNLKMITWSVSILSLVSRHFGVSWRVWMATGGQTNCQVISYFFECFKNIVWGLSLAWKTVCLSIADDKQ